MLQINQSSIDEQYLTSNSRDGNDSEEEFADDGIGQK
jgi:hypothetical protein